MSQKEQQRGVKDTNNIIVRAHRGNEKREKKHAESSQEGTKTQQQEQQL